MSQKQRLYGKSRTIPIIKTTLLALSWIKRAKVRKLIFLNIKKRTLPSDMVRLLAGVNERKSASYYTQVSRALAELEAQGFIRCLNPDEKTGRFYQLTPKGAKIKKFL